MGTDEHIVHKGIGDIDPVEFLNQYTGMMVEYSGMSADEIKALIDDVEVSLVSRCKDLGQITREATQETMQAIADKYRDNDQVLRLVFSVFLATFMTFALIGAKDSVAQQPAET